jgi:hypothetical protein
MALWSRWSSLQPAPHDGLGTPQRGTPATAVPSVSDHHVPESIDIVVNSTRDSDFVERAPDKVEEIFCKSRRQPVIEDAREIVLSAVELSLRLNTSMGT